MEEVTYRVKVETDEAVSSVEKVNDSFEKTAENVEKAEKQTKDLNKATKKSPGAIKKVSAGFKALGTALKGAGIGLVVAGVVKLTDALSQNQTVVDAVNKVFKTIDIVFQQTTTAITNAFESVGKLNAGFKSTVAVISGLINIALAPLKLLIDTVKLGTQEAQLAWEESFFGDGDTETIKRLNKGIKETQKSIVDTRNATIQSAKDVAKNFTGFISEIGTFASEAVDNIKTVNVAAAKDSADAIIELRKQVQLEESQQQEIALRRQTEAERQRKERDDIRNSIEDRIKANDRLGEVLRTQAREEREIAQRRVRLRELELAQNPQNIEAQNALQEAKNGVLEIEERIEGVTAEQRTNEASLIDEQKANLDQLKEIGKTEIQLKEQALQTEFENQRKLIERTVSNEQKKNELLLQAERQHNEKLAELEEEENIKKVERQRELEELLNEGKEFPDTIDGRRQEALAELEIEREKQIQKAIDLEASETQLAEIRKRFANQRNDITEKANQAEKEQEELLTAQKIQLAIDTIGSITSILGEESKAAKGVAIAQALINTYKGISAGVALGFPAAIPAIAAATATGFGAVKNIVATNPTQASSGQAAQNQTGGAQAQAAQQAQAPDFNIVGDAGNNEIAGAIGNRNSRPQKSYVVSKEMTTQAELDRNIEEEASLG